MRLLFTFDKLDGCSCMLIVIYRLTLGLLGMYTRSWENVTPIKKIDAFCIWWYQWKARLLPASSYPVNHGQASQPLIKLAKPGRTSTGRPAPRSNHNGSSTPHNESVFEFQSHHLINFFGHVRVTQKVIFWTIFDFKLATFDTMGDGCLPILKIDFRTPGTVASLHHQ